MKLIILGPPGSGKGTIAEKLVKEFHLYHLSPGQLLREEIQKGTTIGKAIRKDVEQGRLAPSKFVVEIIKVGLWGKKDYLLDGFPRSVDQAEAIEDLNIKTVLYLGLSESAAVQRLAGRRVCQDGQHSYHLSLLPPKQEGICDIDGSKLITRKDDQPKIIRERFQQFERVTRHVVEYYRKKNILKTINADQSPEKVYADVKKALPKK